MYKRQKKIADCVAKVSSQKICDLMQIEQVNVIEEGSLSEIPAFAVVQKWTIIGACLLYTSGVISAVKSFYFLEEHDALGGLEKVGTMLDLSLIHI